MKGCGSLGPSTADPPVPELKSKNSTVSFESHVSNPSVPETDDRLIRGRTSNLCILKSATVERTSDESGKERSSVDLRLSLPFLSHSFYFPPWLVPTHRGGPRLALRPRGPNDTRHRRDVYIYCRTERRSNSEWEGALRVKTCLRYW